MRVRFTSLVLAACLFSAVSRAEAPAILTFVEGSVELFSGRSQKVHDSVPEGSVRVKYEGSHYLASSVKPGMTLPSGAWLRTRPGSRARVVFGNGDQMNVGPASLFKIEAPAKARGSQEMDLRYGMVRSIISKSGPRSGFKVRTASAVMGVRGTDFVVEASDVTALTLIRGSVELSRHKEAAKTVSTGETALVQDKKPVEKFATSQLEFRRVLAATEKSPQAAPVSMPSEVLEREARARDVSKQDLLDHAASPEERKKIESLVKDGADVQTLNRVAVTARIEQAPATSPGLQRLKEQMRKRYKISEQELNELEKDPYGRYFEGTQTE